MRKQRVLSLVLALVMALSLSTGVSADEGGDLTGAVVVIHTGDVHGALEGYAKVAAMKSTYEAAGAYVLLLDAGGFASGSPYVRHSSGVSAVELMNAAGYVAAAVGENELSYGQEKLQALTDLSNFPLLSASVMKGEPLLPTHQIFEAPDGLKIGVFGLTAPEIAHTLSPSAGEGLTFLTGSALVRAAKNEAAALREAGCELVICLSHLGLQGDDGALSLLRQAEGIDLMIDGHAHTTLEEVKKATGGTCMVGETALTAAGSSFAEVGVAVYIDGEIVARSLPLDTIAVSDEAVAAKAAAITDEVDRWLGETIDSAPARLVGGAEARRGETNLGDLVCDAMLVWTEEFGGEVIGEMVDAALLSGGVLRDSIAAGEVCYADIAAALTPGETLCTIRVTGAALMEALESMTAAAPKESSSFPQTARMDFALNMLEPFESAGYYPNTDQLKPAAIHRVTVTAVGYKEFDPEAIYTVAINSSLRPAAFAPFERSRINLGEPLEDVLAICGIGALDPGSYAESAGRMKLVGYQDVTSDKWYASAVDYVSTTGLMQGSAGLFRPGEAMNRAMLVTVLYRMAGSPAVEGTSLFTDVPAGKWYTDAVLWASKNGIVQGQTADTFAPNASITRQQLATFLYRYAQAKPVQSNLSAFTDAGQVSAYAADPLAWAVENGFVGGTTPTTLAPRDTASRAMVAAVLMRYQQGQAE
ncbi:MAG: hypothetical protein HFF61_00115 [Oscillospiraceae bacterium]|nr:hypothetical protein [Oscillospiraceae bacterium]